MASPNPAIHRISLHSPPPGVVPNFNNPQTLGASILGLSIVIILLMTFFVVIRLYSNYHATRGLGWDDWFCVAGTILLSVFIGLGLSLRKYACHDYELYIDTVGPTAYKKIFVFVLLVGPMMCCAKNSILFLYYRIFSPKRHVRYMIVIGIVISLVVNLIKITADGYFCAPHIGQHWGIEVGLSCLGSNIFGAIQDVGNLALDLFIFGLPIPIILRLQLPTKKKMAVLAIFLTAFLAIVASTMSVVYHICIWKKEDPTWNSFIVQICVFVETGVTIICGSMPASASQIKAWVATSPYLSALFSRLSSHITPTPSPPPKPQLPPFRPLNGAKASPNQYLDSNTIHLASYRSLSAFSDGNTRTEVYGAPSQGDIEMGVIMKSVKVEQTSS